MPSPRRNVRHPTGRYTCGSVWTRIVAVCEEKLIPAVRRKRTSTQCSVTHASSAQRPLPQSLRRRKRAAAIRQQTKRYSGMGVICNKLSNPAGAPFMSPEVATSRPRCRSLCQVRPGEGRSRFPRGPRSRSRSAERGDGIAVQPLSDYRLASFVVRAHHDQPPCFLRRGAGALRLLTRQECAGAAVTRSRR